MFDVVLPFIFYIFIAFKKTCLHFGLGFAMHPFSKLLLLTSVCRLWFYFVLYVFFALDFFFVLDMSGQGVCAYGFFLSSPFVCCGFNLSLNGFILSWNGLCLSLNGLIVSLNGFNLSLMSCEHPALSLQNVMFFFCPGICICKQICLCFLPSS